MSPNERRAEYSTRHVPLSRVVRCPYPVVGVKIYVLVLKAVPKAFDEDIVHPTPLAVHADRHLRLLEHVYKELARKLAPLVRVSDFGGTVRAQGFA